MVLAALLLVSGAAWAQWVEFAEETQSRLAVADNLGANDPEEKAYAWGDVDKDGDIDLAVARKQPNTTAGKRIALMLVNQGGTLTDMTTQFASDTDVPGDNGFMTPTNNRDVIMADLNNDGWLDIVTSTAISNGDSKTIGYPRIYRNKCCAVGGCAATTCSTANWLGFRFEDARIPPLLTNDGQAGFNPCFCAVAANDVTGDGFADLYFSDYDTACVGDFDDKLLVNKGAAQPGFFMDVTETNFTGGASGFPVSGFGASGGINKFNQDGVNDILKQTAGFVGLAFNQPSGNGMFDKSNSPYGGSAYFVAYQDLNNDNKLDLVVSDDGQDRYLLNQGDGGDGMADFLSFAYTYKHTGTGGPSSDDGFGGNSVVADLDNDSFKDVIITDVDVDVGGCGRRTHIFHNLGGVVGGSVNLQEQTTGSNCESFKNNPASCLVASIPANTLVGTHDVAAFDINGDGWKDLVIGRCSGTEVYMNQPPFPPSAAVPDGDGTPGQMLMLSKSGTLITLTWGASCSLDDTDYSVYEGSISSGLFQDHVPRACTTGGATMLTIQAGIGPTDSYFLIAPHNDVFEGSLGKDSTGSLRHAGLTPCLPQQVGTCE